MLDSTVAGPIGLIFMLQLGAFGLPFPEELVLLAGGIAAYPDRTALFVMVIAGWFGTLLGDTIVFFMGRYLGGSVVRHPLLGRHLTPERLERFEAYLSHKGPSIILVIRFMTGFRAPAYFSYGAMRFPFRKFIAYDAVAALVSAPLFTILGFTLGHQVADLDGSIRKIQAYIPIVVVAVLVVFIFYRWWKGEQGKTLPPGEK